MLDLQWDMHLLDLHAGGLPPRSLRGAVDRAGAAELEPKLLAYAAKTSGARIVLDCSELDSIDADGVAMLTRVAERGGKLVELTHVTPACARVIRSDIEGRHGATPLVLL